MDRFDPARGARAVFADDAALAHAPAAPAPAAAPASSETPSPDEPLIIVPVRRFVMFPGVVMPVTVQRPASIAAAQEAARTQKPIGVLMQRDPSRDEIDPLNMHRFGVIANIVRYVTTPDGGHHLICQGEQRFFVEEFLRAEPYLSARVRRVEEPDLLTPDIEARFAHLREQATEALQLIPQSPPELLAAVAGAPSPSALADLVAAYMEASPEQKQDILETVDVRARMELVSAILAQRLEVLRLREEISRQTKASIDERQREMLLREQMASIQRQLGEGDGKAQELAELSGQIDKAQMPKEVDEAARKELKRLERMPDASAEYGMIRTYIDWLIELPWAPPDAREIDIREARRILDADHFGLDKIKRRIVEYLAVRKLAPNGKAPILCFLGPPGVGKTSLGQSIAKAMDRKFVRVSLGGVHDEAEIRGHRRTYVGALPGDIIQAIRKAGARDCVMMLDEIDKMGAGVQGDPFSAMLEVLDPEQNSTFRDNYLALPFDLSRVVFIATANQIETIPGPLRDRMEIISLAGYTDEEKLEIAKRYLLPRQLAANGLSPEQARIDDGAPAEIIRGHTREAGVRNLEREIGRVLRHVAVRIADGSAQTVEVTRESLSEILGPPRFEDEVAMRVSTPGVATGLAWTPVGGDILFIEATRTPGGGRLILTGQLGEVMRESAQAALSLLKSRAASLGIEQAAFDKSDIHVHVPAGATPKDGPSAGVAMFVALTSILTGRIVRNDTAMTGEISLRGLVLPVGGIKEKVIAAARSGITRVLLPARNRRDYDDIPPQAREKLAFFWLETVDDALAQAFEDAPAVVSEAV